MAFGANPTIQELGQQLDAEYGRQLAAVRRALQGRIDTAPLDRLVDETKTGFFSDNRNLRTHSAIRHTMRNAAILLGLRYLISGNREKAKEFATKALGMPYDYSAGHFADFVSEFCFPTPSKPRNG